MSAITLYTLYLFNYGDDERLKFEENRYTDLTYVPKCFIYFLIQGDEVVYVGQTKRGLSRVYSHSDKVYDKIYCITVEESALDKWENYYILKYSPMYNKKLNTEMMYSISKIKNKLKENSEINVTKTQIKQAIKKLQISPIFVDMSAYIYVDDFYIIEDYFRRIY